MGEEISTTIASRPGSSTAKNRDATKKQAALWKKQFKCFKLKDVDKKVEAVRFCAQDEKFFREQSDVLPMLMGFLTRTKTPELVLETLNVMHILLATPSSIDLCESGAIHSDINAEFMLERSVSPDAAWKAGEPFINLFSNNSLAPEIRIRAIEVYELLLRASVVISAAAGTATTTMLQFQSLGSPSSALLGCLSAESCDLQFTALSCLRSLMRNPPNEEFLATFEAEKGVSRSLEFVLHSERRFHRPALDIIDSFSQFECGREYLKTNGASHTLRDAIQEAQQSIEKTSAIVPVSGMDLSPVSAKDALLLCSNIEVICQVFVRLNLARDQSDRHGKEDRILFMDVIDAMVAILRYDISSALNPVAVPTESPRTTSNAAAIAAANAAANAAALDSLFPFSIDRSAAVISSIGRLIEVSEECKVHAKAKNLLPVLLDCYSVKEAEDLYQVADKLLHLCIHISDSPDFFSFQSGNETEGDSKQPEWELKPLVITRIDPQTLCAISINDGKPMENDNNEPIDTTSSSANGEKPPLVSVESLLTLLETSLQAANKALIFRLLRWLAALVDLPGHAIELGERAVMIFLQLLATTTSDDQLLFAFLAKCINAIILQISNAFELCGSSGHEPSTSFLDFLLKTSSESVKSANISSLNEDLTFLSQPGDGNDIEAQQSDEQKSIGDQCKLEWIDEYDEHGAFEPKPLTDSCHDVDPFLLVAEALTGLTNAFMKWNSTPIAIDFSELLAAKLEGKSGIPAATTGSKKKLAVDPIKTLIVGEAVMLCILEKGMQILKLVSIYTAVNPAVGVSLLTLLNNLMTVPSGLKVLLNLAKRELPTATPEICVPNELEVQWPISVELVSLTEYALLLHPIINVLQSPDTSFLEIEAAIKSIAVMTSDLEFIDKELNVPSPEPVVEVTKSSSKGGASAVSVPIAPPLIPQLVLNESDRFINAAIGCGALVLLLSFLDYARIPREVEDFSSRVKIMTTQIEEMVNKFITLAQEKQSLIVTKYREKLALESPPTTDLTPTEICDDLNLPYQKRWAQILLDHKFSVPRFGFESYSALLLASELVLPKLITTLLNAGASTETSSPEGVTPLMIAFLVGNEEMVIDLLDARANVDAITTDGHDLTVWNCALVSPLKVRVNDIITKFYKETSRNSRFELDSIEGSLQFLDMCLDAGVDTNVSNAQGDFLLHALLSKSIVRRKIRGSDLCFRYNSYYEDQRRLKRAVVDLIEAHSANVNNCNRYGQTPLHLALLYGYPDIAKILLSRGANPNVQGIYGHLPLHYACLGFCGNLDGSDGEAIKVIQLLLEHAAKHSCTLGIHMDHRKHKSAVEKQALAIENILENGMQTVIKPYALTQKLANAQEILTTHSFVGNFLPWHFACGAHVQLSSVLCLDDDMQKWFEANGKARADIIQYLIQEWEIDVSKTASDGVTALQLAVKSDVNGNNLPVFDTLLGNASVLLNVNAVHDHIFIDSLPVIPNGTQTVLLDTVHDGKLAYVSSRSIDGKYHIILEDGKHFDDVSREQLQVVYDSDKKNSHHAHYKYLLPMESRFSALHYALQSNDDTLALRLLSLPNISLNPEGSDLPLLALACAARQTPEVVGRLITQQANMRVHLPLRSSKSDLTAIDLDTFSSIANRKHAAALHYAVMYDDEAMVKVLLTNPGGYVLTNVRRSRDGYTPLHLACQLEDTNIIKLLLRHGASLTQLSSISEHGVSPLQLLMKFDSLENEKLKELISENYLQPEMLLESFYDHEKSRVEDENQLNEECNDENEQDAPSCALLREEDHNLDLFERLRGLNRDKRGNYEVLTKRLETKLGKSDEVLGLFFDLLRKPQDMKAREEDPVKNTLKLQQPELPLVEKFQKLRHRHECYRQFTTRSKWKPKTKITRAASKTLDESIGEPTSS